MTLLLSPELVGRGAEAAAAERAVDLARGGQGGALVLVGEPGIGKSRLLQHAEAYARAHGLLVLPGRAVDGPSARPFRPLSEALAAGFRDEGVPRHPAVTALLPTLAHLVPQWSTAVAPHGSVLAIAEAVLRLLEIAGRGRGVLLLLEDVHWADQDTLAVLEYLLDNAATHRALCLLTLRPEPPGPLRVVRRAADRRVAAVHELHPLPLGEVDRMVLACLGQDAISADLLGFVRDHADGVPFLVEELLAGLVRAGALAAGGDGWEVTGALTAAVPTTFAGSVERRMEGLGPDDRQVLGAAALLGRDFDWRLLAPITGLAEATVLDSLRIGAAALLLSTEHDAIRFRHALTREHVLASMLPPERSRLARQALATAPPGNPELVAELAVLAGDPERAAQALLDAADAARDRGALATAAARLQRAARLETADPTALLVTERLAEIRALSGDIEGAITLAEPALATRRARGDDPAHVIELELALGRAALTAGSYDRAAEHAGRANTGSAHDPARRARAAVLAAQIAVTRGEVGEARRLAEESIALIGDGQPEVRCEALEVLGRCGRLHDVGAGERLFESALEVARRHGLSLWRARALHELGTIDLLDRMATDRLVAARRAAIEAGAPALAAVADFHLASALVARNELADGRAVAQRAVDLSERLGLSILPVALTILARSYAHERDHASVERIVGRITAIASDDPAVLAGVQSHVYAMLALHEADRDAALSALDKAAALLRQAPAAHDPHRGLWALLRTLGPDAPFGSGALSGPDAPFGSGALSGPDAAYGLGASSAGNAPSKPDVSSKADTASSRDTPHDRNADPGGAAARAETASAVGSDTRCNRAMLLAAEAVAAGRSGDRETAQAQFGAALADLRGYQGGEWMVQLVAWLAAPAAHADGWGDPAGWLQTAVRWFTDHRYDALAASCRRLLRTVGVPVPRAGRGRSQVPDQLRVLGVTSREVDVLHLIVAGLTNRQIAQRLVLSPKTVEKHVASMLSKTGRANRDGLRRGYRDLLGAPPAQ